MRAARPRLSAADASRAPERGCTIFGGMGNVVVCSGETFVASLLVAGLMPVRAFALGAVARGRGGRHLLRLADAGRRAPARRPRPARSAKPSAKAGNGDSVSLAAGELHRCRSRGITLEKAIDFGAAPGAPAILLTDRDRRGRGDDESRREAARPADRRRGRPAARAPGRPNGSSSPTRAWSPTPASSKKARPCATASAGRWKRPTKKKGSRTRSTSPRPAKTRTRPWSSAT